jgi:hypothetical protein
MVPQNLDTKSFLFKGGELGVVDGSTELVKELEDFCQPFFVLTGHPINVLKIVLQARMVSDEDC